MQLIDDYRDILLDNRPLLDVRAPIEFKKGAFPAATNIPLLEDDERARVGTAYSQDGHDAAVALGHRLVSGNTRQERLDRWLTFAQAHPDGALYCFRGGQRSELVQTWMAEAGCDYPRVRGGYKAMRRYLIDAIERLCRESRVVLIGGRTGVGKTELLPRLPATIDLEGIARHRGSGFGRRIEPQPGNIDFEHQLTIAWLRLEAAGSESVVMEDESRCVGSCALPQPLWEAFGKAPLLVLEDDLESRVARIRREYVEEAAETYAAAFGEVGFQRYAEALCASLDRIRKRLGGARHQELSECMRAALTAQRDASDPTGHDEWIRHLLIDYYDPMYDYQLTGKMERVVFRGDADAVVAYLARSWRKVRFSD